jgi:hypothetical protein
MATPIGSSVGDRTRALSESRAAYVAPEEYESDYLAQTNAKLATPAFQAIWQQVQQPGISDQQRKNYVSLAENWMRQNGVDLRGGAYEVDPTGRVNPNTSGMPWWMKAAIIGMVGGAAAPALLGAAGVGGGAAATGLPAATVGAPAAFGVPVAGAGLSAVAPAAAAGTTAATTAATAKGLGTLGTLGKYSTAAGEVGQTLANISSGRAQGRYLESQANIDTQRLENEMYDAALKRAIQGRLMNTNWPGAGEPPPGLVPFLGGSGGGGTSSTSGTPAPTTARDGFGDSLISGAAPSLAHPPTFDARGLNPQPNWVDKTLNVVSPILSGVGVLGKYTGRPTTPTLPDAGNLARTTGTAMSDSSYLSSPSTAPATRPRGASFLTGTELPPYTSPVREGAGLMVPSDPSDPWATFIDQQRRRRAGTMRGINFGGG